MKILNGDFGINGTFNNNNVEKIYGGIDLKEGGLGNGEVTTSTVEGRPIGSFWVYNVDGIFQTQSEVDNSPHVTGTLPGDFKYTDINDDGFIDERDRIYVGSYQPNFNYGINGGLIGNKLISQLIVMEMQVIKFIMVKRPFGLCNEILRHHG